MPDRRPTSTEYRQAAELRGALRAFMAESEQVIRKHALTPKRYELLLLVKVSDPGQSTVSNLAAKLAIGQSAATQLVRRAQDDGMLSRRLSPSDARIHQLRLTAKGHARLEAALSELGSQRDELIQRLTALR